VLCDFEDVKLPAADGATISGVRARCRRCDHVTESFGRENRSRLRCLALMREECGLAEDNFYEAANENQMEVPL